MEKRTNVLAVKLTPSERATIDALARQEKLPVSTLARRTLLFWADQKGIVAISEIGNSKEEVGKHAAAISQ